MYRSLAVRTIHYHISFLLKRQIVRRIVLYSLCLRCLYALYRLRLHASSSRISSFGCQHFHVVHIDFGDITQRSRLIVIRTCPYLAFQIKLVAFMHVFVYNFSKTVRANNVVPFCPFRNLRTVLQCISTVGRSQRKVATADPESKYFTLGSCPTFPNNITLFTDIT